jgi:hypothetical protein
MNGDDLDLDLDREPKPNPNMSLRSNAFVRFRLRYRVYRRRSARHMATNTRTPKTIPAILPVSEVFEVSPFGADEPGFPFELEPEEEFPGAESEPEPELEEPEFDAEGGDEVPVPELRAPCTLVLASVPEGRDEGNALPSVAVIEELVVETEPLLLAPWTAVVEGACWVSTLFPAVDCELEEDVVEVGVFTS